MTESLRYFRERAAECERLATEVQDPRARETFLYVASRWRALIEADATSERRVDLTEDRAAVAC